MLSQRSDRPRVTATRISDFKFLARCGMCKEVRLCALQGGVVVCVGCTAQHAGEQ
jgi:hypothetical protein